MPRRPLIYTHDFPYHVTARTNNKEWFNAPIEEVWKLFEHELSHLSREYNMNIHAFILMSNHYHLIASCSEKFDLGYLMRILQTRTASGINSISGRINHVYGRRYRGSLISDEFYYANAYKYLFRNSISAGLTSSVMDWPYSTINSMTDSESCKIPISCHSFEKAIFDTNHGRLDNVIDWIDDNFSDEDYGNIKLGLTRSQFLFKKRRAPLKELL